MKKILFPILTALLLTGCATRPALMEPIQNPDNTIPKGKAVVTFFRTSNFYGPAQVLVARETDENNIELVGTTAVGTQVRDIVDPGEVNYVIDFEAPGFFDPDVLKGNVEADKAYYVRVEPHVHFKALRGQPRFVLHKIKPTQLITENLIEKIKATKVVETNKEGEKRFSERKNDLKQILLEGKENFNKYSEKEQNLHTIQLEDGVNELVH